MKDTTAHYVSIIKSSGYRVFMCNPQLDEYCFYTDGAHIGYAEWANARGPSVSSVHIPNAMSGAGFHVANEITPESLKAAIICHVPEWATATERASVRKYSSWNEFHTKEARNSSLIEV